MQSAPTIGFTREDLARLASCSSGRTRLLHAVRDGQVSVADVPVVASSAFLAATRLVKVLEVHPSLGKVAARRLVAELGMDEQTAVSGVSPEQWTALAARIESSNGTPR